VPAVIDILPHRASQVCDESERLKDLIAGVDHCVFAMRKASLHPTTRKIVVQRRNGLSTMLPTREHFDQAVEM
jgi:hypothetical protein